MRLDGLSRRPSTSLNRIWPSVSRPATLARLGPTLPCNLSSGAGNTWQTMQLPRSRLKLTSRPRVASPGLPVSDCGTASPTTATAPGPSAPPAGPPARGPASSSATTARAAAPSLTSCLLQLHVLERMRGDRLAGCRIDGVQHSRGRHADGGLAHSAPEPAGGRQYRFNLGEVLHQHGRIGVEVLLDDPAILDRALLQQQGAEAIGDRPLDLGGHLVRVDDVTAVRSHHQAMDLQLAAVAHRYLGCGGDVAAIAHVLGNAAMDASRRRRLAPADLVGHGIEHGQVLGMVGHHLAAELEGILAGRLGELVDEGLEPDRVLV